MKPYLFFMFLCALGNSLLAQNCNGNFQDHYSIFRSNGENFRQFADINNDQLTDLITQDNSAIAHFYINTGVGFTPAGSLQLPLFGNVVAVKDFDNDGYADLLSNSITGSTCLNNQIRIFWNTGSTGSNYNTGLSTNLPLPVNPYCMQSQDIDFDSDGLLDVIATSMPFGPGSNNPGRTYKNLGNRQFAVASDFLWPRDLYGTYTRDFDGDGNADFLVTVKDGWADGLRGMYYYRGNGNGTFQSPIINFNTAPLAAGGIPIQSDPQSNTTNDVLMSLNGVSPSTVKLGRWNGTNNFSFDNITIPTGFAMGQAFDYNLDGVQDIMIFSTSTPSTIRTMYGAGNGTYTPDDSNLLQSDSFTLSTLFQDEDAPEQYITAYSNDSLKVYKRSSPELQVIQEEASICAGAAYNFNGTELTESGVYNQVLFQNAQGCDSVMISLSLNVLEPVSSEISVTLNEGEVYDFFGEQLTSAGEYIQTLQSASGCDSTVILTLTFETTNNPCGSGLFEFNWMRIIDENSSRVGQLNGFITTNCSIYRNNWRNQIQPISINNNGKVCIQGVSSCDPILATLNASNGDIVFEDIYESPFQDLGLSVIATDTAIYSTALIAKENNSENTKVVFRKHGLEGDLQFDAEINDYLRNASVMLKPTIDGRFFLYGNAYNEARNAIRHSLYCYDSEGNQLWSNVAPDYDYFYGYSGGIDVDSEGNAIVLSKRQGPGGPSGYNIVIRKFSVDGVELWRYEYDYAEDYGYDLKLDPSGNVYFCLGVRPSELRLVKLDGTAGTQIFNVQVNNADVYASMCINDAYIALSHQSTLKLISTLDGSIVWSAPMASANTDNISFHGNEIIVTNVFGIEIYDFNGNLIQTITIPGNDQLWYRSSVANDNGNELYLVGQRIGSGSADKIFVARFTRTQSDILCDDGNPCTTGDAIQADCSCEGILVDANEDGICDTQNNCLPSDTTYQCFEDVPAESTLPDSIYCENGLFVEFFGSQSDYEDTLICNEVTTPAGPGQDWGLWVSGLYSEGLASTDWYRWVGTPTLVFSQDGEARLIGDAIALNNPLNGWHIDATLVDGLNWEDWSEQGGQFMDQLGLGAQYHESWHFYKLLTTISRLEGFGEFEGDQLILSHQPANHSYGFQFGQSANNRNSNRGGSGWFFYNGFVNGEQVSGHGDFTLDMGCEAAPVANFCGGSLERRWALTDSIGNVSYQNQSIIVLDNTPPVFINCPSNMEVECSENVPSPVNAVELVATDNCAGEVAISYYSSDTTFFNGLCNYAINHYYTAYDNCGNRELCQYTISVSDNTAPEIYAPADFTAQCSDELALEAPTATDNCASDVVITESIDTLITDCTITYQRQFTATDNCGNSSQANQQITVIDTEAPVFVALDGPYTVECDALFDEQWVNPAAIDNCDEDLTYTYTDEITSGGCLGVLHRTVTVTDDCGNATTRDFVIYVHDTTAPVFTWIPEDATVECGNIPTAPSVDAIQTSDNCGNAQAIYGVYAEGHNAEVTVTFNEEISEGICPGSYVIRWIWTATDYCENTSTAITTLTVVDSTPPVALNVPANQTVECSQFNGGLNLEAPEFIDSCSGVLDVTANVTEEIIGCERVYTYAWSASDACGNTSTASATITVVDQSGPVFTALPTGGNYSCDGGIDFGIAEATDACGLAEITFSDEFIAGNCNNSYSIARTWIATDDCGNSTTALAVYNVTDDVAPVFTSFPDDVTIECDVTELPAAGATATDNCNNEVEISFVEILVAQDNCQRTYDRVYTATDACGNSVTQVQHIYANDTASPTFNGNATITLSCDEFESDGIYTSANDNCGQTTISILYDEPSGEGCGSSVIRHYAAFDNCGNSSYFNQTIVVTDNEAPTPSEDPADTMYECTQNWAPAEISFTDNCSGDVTVTSTVEESGDACSRSYHYVWIATDVCGNTTVVDQFITVVDETAPVFDLESSSITVECGTDVNLPSPIAIDNCSEEVSITEEQLTIAGNCSGNYTLVTTYTAIDNCGNSSSITRTINYQDTTAPVWNNNTDLLTYECGQEATTEEPIAVDNCSSISYQFSDGIMESNGCSGSFVRTWAAIDACGNTSVPFLQTIVFEDTTEPVLENCPADVTLACDAEIPSPAEVIVTDNCDNEISVSMIETCIDCPSFGSDGYELSTPARPTNNPCLYPYDWAMALFSLPSNYRWYQLDTAAQAQMVYNNDGSISFTGRVFNVVYPTGGFDFNVTYANGKTWQQWSTDNTPSGFKADCGGEDGNYQDWMYYILQNGEGFELTGWGSQAGSQLSLSHAPSNQYFGFQVGDGANNYNDSYGAGGWFNFSGSILYNGQLVSSNQLGGIGDFAFEINECPAYSVVRTWTAIDCSGNTSSCSQTLLFNNQDNSLSLIEPANDNSEDREDGISILGIRPNPAGNSSSISFMSTINGKLTLEVLDVTGRVVSSLFNNEAVAGQVYTMDFDAHQVSTGIYMVRLNSETDFEIERLYIQK